MILLELRNGNTQYNPGWNFSESVWAPLKKENGGRWPFWSLIRQVTKGDIVFHLRNANGRKEFCGFSTALTDGYITEDAPINHNHKWGFSQSFYKVDLNDFKRITPEIPLSRFFTTNDRVLRNYFRANKVRGNNKKRLFYVIQRGKLQCLNGAYFSEFDSTLSRMLLNGFQATQMNNRVAANVSTGVSSAETEQRIGHQEFSDNVKDNFNYRCCFPNCEVEGKGFLISGHIDRWADNEDLRGNTGNGLCLCLMHDKAFENGYFTLDEDFHVRVINQNIGNRQWLRELLQYGEDTEIKPRQIDPLLEALRAHWVRIGYEE